jgi:excisionase family DNA binding protein
MDKVLTIIDVANQLQLAQSTIYKYTESGIIPSIKVGNRTRIMESELNKYLNSCKNTAKKETTK